MLHERCKDGIEITTNKSMVLESRRMILGQSEVDLWWFVVFSVSVILLAYVFWVWDMGRLKHFWWQHFRTIKRGAEG
jgi:hypothetical protein